MTEHTKGPWNVCRMAHAVSDTWGITSEETGNWIAKCHPFNGDQFGQKEADANARLIAAAPELLNALKECVTEEGSNGRREGLGRQIRRLDAINEIARQAIAKAEGGKQ